MYEIIGMIIKALWAIGVYTTLFFMLVYFIEVAIGGVQVYIEYKDKK